MLGANLLQARAALDAGLDVLEDRATGWLAAGDCNDPVVGDKVRAVIADIKQRDLHRKQAPKSAVPMSEDDEETEIGE
ncbi:MAG: hypothetical protein ACLQIB_34645 [Isosphaeraceae bacterium]